MRAAPLLLALLLRLRPAAAALDPGPHCPPDQACVALYNDTGLDYYYKVHGVKLEIKLSGNDYMLTCSENVTLDSEALPRFDEHKTFSTVKLAKCRLPARGLSAALAALRVRPLARLQLLRVPPAAALAAAHLAGLAVRELQLEADDDLAALRAEPGFLGPLPALVDLWLKRVALPPAAVLELPAGLKALTLIDVGLAELPRAALARLPELRRLTLERASLTAAPDLSASPKLAELTLDAPVDGVTLGPALRRLDLRNAADATLRGDCGALERLRVSGVARALPADWLRRCGRLAELRLEALPPGELAADVLRGAAWLTKLVVRNDSVCCVTPQRCSRACVGLRLAPRLLEDAAALRVLDLADSGLANITGELFGATKKLEELILSTNNLTADMVDDLSQFKSLKRLNLARNPLGDLCRSTKNYISNGVSPLRDMTALTELQLQETRATRICRDWRLQLASLEKLDLRYNNINYLEYEDLQWTRAERLTVDLDGNNITAVIYSEQQYSLPDSATTPPGLTIKMNSNLTCDCQVYWFARAIQEARATGGRGHALAAVRCRAPDEPLTRMRPALLQCALPAEQCAPKCACAVTGRATVLRCERAGLASLPRLSAPPLPVRELYLAGNNITDPRAEDLPPNLEMLDLSDNGIEKLEADEARELLTRVTGRVELRGNRLACGCGQRGALRVLTAHAARLGDAMCSDGRALLTLAPDELCDATILAAASAGVALLLLAVVVLVCLSRRSVTARIKKFLLDHNLCLSWLLRPRDEYVEDEEGVRYDYDAFVSFSHHDEKFVTEELVPGLEGGARGRRLCLHYRDWTPGAWIPAQIEWSVRRSRHTVVVLSDSFARSSWTRAEFREAHAAALRDARPRLVVVLLADSPDALAPLLDAELRAFLAANTYLRRGDPWFWTKLLRAVSRGRARLPLPADPPPPPPPLAPPPPHLAPPPPHLAPPPPHLAPPPPPQHVPPAAAPPAPPAAA